MYYIVDLFGTTTKNINDNNTVESSNWLTISHELHNYNIYADYDNNKEMHDSHRSTNYSY